MRHVGNGIEFADDVYRNGLVLRSSFSQEMELVCLISSCSPAEYSILTLRSIRPNHPGPEVTTQALRLLTLLSSSPQLDLELTLESHDFGGIAIDNFGVPLPESTLKACKEADAVLLGE